MITGDKSSAGVYFVPPTFSFHGEKNLRKADIPWNTYLPPMEPILSLIRSRLMAKTQVQRESVIHKARFYGYQKHQFKSLISDEAPGLWDRVPFYPAELRFERQRWFEALARVADLSAEPGEKWLLNHIQNASPGLLHFLDAFQNLNRRKNLIIIGTVTQRRNWNLSRTRDPWYPLLDVLDRRGGFLQSGGEAFEKKPLFNPEKSNNPASLIQNCLEYHCWEDPLGWSESTGEDLPGFWGEILLVNGLLDKAVLFLQQAWDSRKKSPGKENLGWGLAYCRALGFKKDLAAARRILHAVEKEAAAHQSLDVLIRLHHIFLEDQMDWTVQSSQEAEDLREDLVSAELPNMVGYLDSLMPIYRQRILNHDWQGALLHASTALERASALGNDYRVSVMQHILGYIHEIQGQKALALNFFRKGIRLRQKLGDPGELIKVYNGTGYFCFSIGRFDLAATYFSKSLTLLKDSQDFTETCLTLFNLSLISVFSGLHEDALNLLETLLEVMDVLGYQALPWHKKPKLQALAAVMAWHSGRVSLAREYLETMESDQIDQEALPYVYLAKGVLGEGLVWFEKGLDLVSGHSQKHLLVQFQVEKILQDQQTLKNKDLESALRVPYTIAKDAGLLLQAAWIDSLWHPGFGHRRLRLDKGIQMLVSGLKSSAQREAATQKFREKIRELNFLRIFQSTVRDALGEKAFWTEVRTQLMAQFQPEKIRLLQGTGSGRGRGEDMDVRFEGENGEILRLSMVPRKEEVFDPEDRRLFDLAMNHMTLAWNLRLTRIQLEKTSSQDHLTGVLVRREFLSRLKSERRRALRYAGLDRPGFSLLFLDLDNFKKYNDRLGHDAGDWVLRKFCGLVTGCLRDIDIVGRFGGDEFMVLLPETSAEPAKVVADRILEHLKAAGGFLNELKTETGVEIPFSQEELLGCSIGGICASGKEIPEAEELVKVADRRLYLAKKLGKNCACWDDN